MLVMWVWLTSPSQAPKQLKSRWWSSIFAGDRLSRESMKTEVDGRMGHEPSSSAVALAGLFDAGAGCIVTIICASQDIFIKLQCVW